jgi:UDP-N-acetylmuramoylalanine--D-glutamate ligase
VSVRDTGDATASGPLAELLQDEGVELRRGESALGDTEGFDLAVISPGIDAKAPLARAFSEKGVPVLGEIEFADRFNDKPIVAITGTNGKTTTTEIVERILNANGQKTDAAGNYGKAYSEVVLEGACDVITLEVSSFQLEGIVDFRPDISVWLNFAPDHLDRYASVGDYRAAKLRIFENQTASDFAVVNSRDELGALVPQTVSFSAFDESGDYTLRGREIFFEGAPVFDYSACRLRGTHNAENLMAAIAVGRLRGIPFAACEKAVADYEPPPHRSELVATVDGREYINDSKATNLHALEQSLLSQPEPVILIAGGKEKGLPFDSLAGIVSENATHVIAIGEIRESLAAAWSAVVPCETAESLEEAVYAARDRAGPGQTILFSPGTSSFDMFRNYEERGNAFREITSNLQ